MDEEIAKNLFSASKAMSKAALMLRNKKPFTHVGAELANAQYFLRMAVESITQEQKKNLQ